MKKQTQKLIEASKLQYNAIRCGHCGTNKGTMRNVGMKDGVPNKLCNTCFITLGWRVNKEGNGADKQLLKIAKRGRKERRNNA